MDWNSPIPSEVISNSNGEAEQLMLNLRTVLNDKIQYSYIQRIFNMKCRIWLFYSI